MAINIPTSFGQNYAGAASGGGSSAMQDYIKEFYPTVEEDFKQDYKESIDLNMQSILDGWGKNIDDWGSIDFTKIKNPATAFMEFENSITSEGGKKSRYAKKNNLLDPIAYLSAYKERIGTLVPALSEKLVQYQFDNNLNDEQMRDVISQHTGLEKLLKQYVPRTDEQGNPNMAYNFIDHKQSVGEDWAKSFRNMPEAVGDMFRPEGFAKRAAIGGLGLAAVGKYGPKAAKLAKKGANWATGGRAGKIVESGKNIIKNSPKKVLNWANKGSTGPAVKSMMNNIVSKIEKHGTAKVIQYLAKNVGWKITARTAAKIGLGTAVSGGVLTAAMLAWSAKDLYEIANSIQNMP